MSETTPAPTAPTNGQAPVPPLVVNIQFVKDLSFEVPGAPEIFSTLRTQPNVQINLDVQARRIQDGESIFEVTLVVKAEATEGAPPDTGRPVFIAELSYSGIFTLNGIPDNSVEPVLLQPIDFVALWQARKQAGTVGNA